MMCNIYIYIIGGKAGDIGDNEEKGNNKDGIDEKEKEKEKEEREVTFLDKLFYELKQSSKISESVILSFKSYLFLNEYDTDGLKYDISQNNDDDNNDDINNSYILQFILLKKQQNLFKTIKQIIKKIGFHFLFYFSFFFVFFLFWY